MRAKSDRAEAQRVVEAAEAIAAQVERHVAVAERAQRAVDRVGHVRLERARHLVAADLEPRDGIGVPVVPDATDAESRASRSTSSACSIIRSLASVTSLKYGMRDDRHADAGSSHVGKPGPVRQLADLRLRQADLVERTDDAEFPRGLAAGTIVATIVGVAAVGDRRECRAARAIAERCV